MSLGRFLLTGSANILTLPQLSDSLAGCMEILPLYLLAEVELRRNRGRFLDEKFSAETNTQPGCFLGDQLAEYIVQRDLKSLSNIQHLQQMPELLQLLAARTGGLLNVSELGRDAKRAATSLTRYLTLLENVFLVERLPPWSCNRINQLTKQLKLHIVDSGLACALGSISTKRLIADRTLLGILLESFLYAELRKLASWNQQDIGFYHFRSPQKADVDIVLTNEDRQLVGIEIKATSTIKSNDLKGLKALSDRAGKRFHRGVILYDGEESLQFGDSLLAVPISRVFE